jgi:amidase
VGEDEFTVLLCELHDDLSAYLAARPGEGPRSLSEVIRHEDAHAERELAVFGHDLLERSLATGGRAHRDYAGARERNLAWARETLEAALGEGDVALSGAYAPAWKSDLVNGDHPAGVSPAIQAAAIVGWPILSLPVGLVGGLPVGLTLVARAGEEWTLLDAARLVERLVAPVGRPTWTVPGRG